MKKQITLRIDEDVVTWFKSQGKGYQSAMNDALRRHMDYEGGKSALDDVDLSYPGDEFIEMKPKSRAIKLKITKIEKAEPPEIPDPHFRPNPKQGKKAKK